MKVKIAFCFTGLVTDNMTFEIYTDDTGMKDKVFSMESDIRRPQQYVSELQAIVEYLKSL